MHEPKVKHILMNLTTEIIESYADSRICNLQFFNTPFLSRIRDMNR